MDRMMKLFAWLFNKRIRELENQIEGLLIENEQLREQLNKMNSDLYKTTSTYLEISKKLENKMKSLSELREELAEQRAKTAHYVELYLEATKEKKY